MGLHCAVDLQGESNELVWYGTTDSGVLRDFIVYRVTNLVAAPRTPVRTNARSESGTNIWLDGTFAGIQPVYYRVGIAP